MNIWVNARAVVQTRKKYWLLLVSHFIWINSLHTQQANSVSWRRTWNGLENESGNGHFNVTFLPVVDSPYSSDCILYTCNRTMESYSFFEFSWVRLAWMQNVIFDSCQKQQDVHCHENAADAFTGMLTWKPSDSKAMSMFDVKTDRRRLIWPCGHAGKLLAVHGRHLG